MVRSPFTQRSARPSPFRSLAPPDGHELEATKFGEAAFIRPNDCRAASRPAVHRARSFTDRATVVSNRSIVAARAASRAAFVSVTLAPKMRPNWMMPTISSRTGRSTAANSTIAWPRSAGRDRPAGTAGIGAGRIPRWRWITKGTGSTCGLRRLRWLAGVGGSNPIVWRARWYRYRPLGAVGDGTDGAARIGSPCPT